MLLFLLRDIDGDGDGVIACLNFKYPAAETQRLSGAGEKHDDFLLFRRLCNVGAVIPPHRESIDSQIRSKMLL